MGDSGGKKKKHEAEAADPRIIKRLKNYGENDRTLLRPRNDFGKTPSIFPGHVCNCGKVAAQRKGQGEMSKGG